VNANQVPVFFFSRNFFKIYGNHPKEDLATSGYKLDVDYTSLINLAYSWLHTKTPNIEIWQIQNIHYNP
jgi:hypothetical protein